MDRERERKIWDCDSRLYDSFELKSFKQQLDSAISSSRCMSMPRLPDPIPTSTIIIPKKKKKKGSAKVLRSVRRMIGSVFKSKPPANNVVDSDSRHLILGPLSTIPEASEKGVDSPDLDSVVRRSVSERFTASSSSSGTVIREQPWK